MIRKWEKYNGRKNSIMMKMCYSDIDESYLWTYNKKWLREWVKLKLITNLEYLDGLNALKEVQK